jgi:hypothetical protein
MVLEYFCHVLCVTKEILKKYINVHDRHVFKIRSFAHMLMYDQPTDPYRAFVFLKGQWNMADNSFRRYEQKNAFLEHGDRDFFLLCLRHFLFFSFLTTKSC